MGCGASASETVNPELEAYHAEREAKKKAHEEKVAQEKAAAEEKKAELSAQRDKKKKLREDRVKKEADEYGQEIETEKAKQTAKILAEEKAEAAVVEGKIKAMSVGVMRRGGFDVTNEAEMMHALVIGCIYVADGLYEEQIVNMLADVSGRNIKDETWPEMWAEFAKNTLKKTDAEVDVTIMDPRAAGFVTFKNETALAMATEMLQEHEKIYMDAKASEHRKNKVRMSKKAAINTHLASFLIKHYDPLGDRTWEPRFSPKESLQTAMWQHVLRILPKACTEGEAVTELAGLLTDLVFLEEKCRAGQVSGLIEDYQRAAEQRQLGVLRGSPVELYGGLVKANAHLLTENPHQLFSAAFNSPDNGAPALDARQLLVQPQKRSWLRTMGAQMVVRHVLKWIGKPQQRDPNIATWLTDSSDVSEVTCFAYSHPWMACGARDGKLKLWNAHTQKEVCTLEGHEQAVNGLLFIGGLHQGGEGACIGAPQLPRLASGSDDGTIRIWDLTHPPPHPTVLRFSEAKSGAVDRPVLCLTLSPDGGTLAAGMAHQGMSLWDVGASPAVYKGWLPQDDGPVRAAAFHPEGLTLAVGSQPGGEAANKLCGRDGEDSLKLWNVHEEAVQTTLLKDSELVDAVAFTPDGASMLVALRYGQEHEERGISSWVRSHSREQEVWKRQIDEDNRPLMMKHKDTGPVIGLSLDPTGGLCIAMSACGTVKLWDHKLLSLKGRLGDMHGLGQPAVGVHFPPGTTCFATAGTCNIRIWDLEGIKEYAMLKPEGHANRVQSLSFSSDGEVLASAGASNVKLWTRVGHFKSQLSWRAEERKWIVSSVAFTPDGTLLACVFVAAGEDDHVVIFDVPTGEEKRAIGVPGCSNALNAINFSPDNQSLALAKTNGDVTLWRLSGDDIATAGHFAAVHTVAFSNDGKQLASGCADTNIKLWQVDNARFVCELTAHTGVVREVQWSPTQSTLLASASDDGTVILWDTVLKCVQLQIRDRVDPLQPPVNSVSFSPDGLHLALGLGIGSQRSVCEMWSIKDVGVIEGGSIIGHTDLCACVKYSPDPNPKHEALASASGKYIYTSVSNLTAKSDAIAEAKALEEMEAKQAALMEQAAVEAAAKAAREAAELSAQKKKVMLMKAELAREAAEADDAEASWQAMEASRVAVAESLESARSSLAPLRADMETKMMFFSQVAADAEVATEEQAESIIKQKATMLKADDLESEAVMLNQNATDFPNPDNEKLALEAVKQHEAAKIEREEALEHVKKVIAECEKLTAEKSESYQSASNSKELFEQASTEVLELMHQLETITAQAAAAKIKADAEREQALSKQQQLGEEAPAELEESIDMASPEEAVEEGAPTEAAAAEVWPYACT